MASCPVLAVFAKSFELMQDSRHPLKFLAGQNKILQDRRLVCNQITISFLPEIMGHLSDKLKFSAGQNENLPVLSDSPAVFVKTVPDDLSWSLLV